MDANDDDPLVASADSDCDGVGDACDVCPGGDDTVDNNGDGIADCSQLLDYADYSDDWKCGNNKILICHVPPGNPSNPQTICISKNALPAHFNNHDGDHVGPCMECPAAVEEDTNGDNDRSNQAVELTDITLFPNPALDNVNIRYSAKSDSKVVVRVSDVLGTSQIVETYAAQKGENNFNLDVSAFRNGVYLIKIQVGKEIHALRFVVEDTH